MTKVDFIALRPDNTFEEKRCKVIKNKVKFDKFWQPELVLGKSVFPEGKKRGFFKFLRRSKRHVFGVYGEPKCYTIDEMAGRLNADWTKEEAKNFISKLMAWALVAGKPFSNLQIYLMMGLLVGLLVLNILIIRRIGI